MLRNLLSAVFACGLFTATMLSIPASVDAQTRSTSTAGGVGIGRGKGNDRPKTEAPEINAYGAPAALAIVLGGAAIVLGRRRRKSV